MERRKFINRLVLNTGVILAVPFVIQSCEKDSEETPTLDPNPNGNDLKIDITSSTYQNLQSDGGYAYVNNNIIVVNTGSNNFVALSSVCTHQGCKVDYDNSKQQLPCPCHGSVFSITGAVVNGPAQTPLKKYTTELNGNMLTIK